MKLNKINCSLTYATAKKEIIYYLIKIVSVKLEDDFMVEHTILSRWFEFYIKDELVKTVLLLNLRHLCLNSKL